MALNPNSANVIVVGGGYSGAAVAKLLDRKFDVTLIEKQETFFHNVGALRAAVDPSILLNGWIHKEESKLTPIFRLKATTIFLQWVI